MIDLLESLTGKRKATKLLSFAVIIVGIVVMLGWIFNVPVLKSIHPDWISMKFSTALCFLLSGINIYFIVRFLEGDIDKSPVILSIVSLIILLLMGTLFFSAILGMHTGAENLFIKETISAAKTVTPGLPSMLTMINFLLMALAGILTILNLDKLLPKLKAIGFIIAIIGGIAVFGYIFNTPLLYYFIAGINSAMALHTAILFVLLGVGLICL